MFMTSNYIGVKVAYKGVSANLPNVHWDVRIYGPTSSVVMCESIAIGLIMRHKIGL